MKTPAPNPKDEAGAVKQREDAAALVTLEQGRPMVDSLTVAHEFGKSHKNVLRDVGALQPDLSAEFWRLNFEPSTYTDNRGKVQRMFCMTQAGFTALVMGFTGKKAVSLRERFIVAFERIAAELDFLKAQRAAAGMSAARELARVELERKSLERDGSAAGRTLGSLRRRRAENDRAAAPLLAAIQPELPFDGVQQ